VSSPTRGRNARWRSRTLLGGFGYVCLLFVVGWIAGLSFSLGPSLPGTGLPILVSSALGVAVVGAFAAGLTGFGLRSPALVASVAVPVAFADYQGAVYVAGTGSRLSSKRLEEDVPGMVLSTVREIEAAVA
jgi:hypothetical protein